MPKLSILLEISPDTIAGGYLLPRMLQVAKIYQDLGWQVILCSPGKLLEFHGYACREIRSKTLAKNLADIDQVYLFLSTHPHWAWICAQQNKPFVVDASNFPWLERRECLPWTRQPWRLLGDLSYGALMRATIRQGRYFTVSHKRQGEYIRKWQPLAQIQVLPFEDGDLEIANSLEIEIPSPYFVVGGGLWPWLDHATLFTALRKYFRLGGRSKIVIPLGTHAEFFHDQEKWVREIEQDADLQRGVLLLQQWVPKSQWNRMVQGAIASINSQPNTPETYYAFRTRVLHALRLGVPVLSTEGDYFASEIQKQQLGLVHCYGDAQALAEHMHMVEKSPKIQQSSFAKWKNDLTSESSMLLGQKLSPIAPRSVFFWGIPIALRLILSRLRGRP